jgi:hypothetical protein
LTAAQVGQILALAGLALLILGTMGRRRSRGWRGPGARGLSRWWHWSDLAAYGLILAGLVIMWAKK